MNRPSTIVISDFLLTVRSGVWTPFEAAAALKAALAKEGYLIAPLSSAAVEPQDEDQEYAETMRGVAQQLRMVTALESIAAWRKVNISSEYEHGLRDIIRSITDCAAAALEATAVSSHDRAQGE